MAETLKLDRMRHRRDARLEPSHAYLDKQSR
jgi:hypothetical protein